MSRHALILTALLTAACSAAPGTPPPSPAPGSSPAADLDAPLPNPIPPIVARVNGRAIEARSIVPIVRSLTDQGTDTERKKELPRAFREALRQYVDRELLFQEALRQGLQANDELVQYAYDRVRVEYKDDDAWKTFLKNGGFDADTFRTELRVHETIGVLLRREAAGVAVDDAEARARFDADPSAFPPPEGQAPGFEAVKQQVRARLLEEKRAAVASRLLESLRAKASIETYI